MPNASTASREYFSRCGHLDCGTYLDRVMKQMYVPPARRVAVLTWTLDILGAPESTTRS